MMINNLKTQIFPISIEKELKNSYLDYAMSVIVSRALPDVRDGLKPVHRRILFAMNKLKNFYNLPYKKSARIVGEVIGKYHPHGDHAVYDSIVRMAQYFSLRYPLIDGQGNFGSIDGDTAAAMRYTEIRLSKISNEILEDLEKDTVNFINNYDNTTKIPIVLPTKIPNLLINGCTGIAVGMATNIPPHNLTEVINGCLAYIKDNNISIENLMKYIIGPDFPTGAIIKNKKGLLEAYKTGKGKILIQSKYKIKKNNTNIIFYEIPYQINKAKLIENIAVLIKEKKIEGISNIRDESDKDGLRIVIELKKEINVQKVINLLFNNTSLQIPFYINMVAIHLGKPKLINLKEIIKIFIDYRCEIIKKKILYDLKSYKKKINILEAYIFILPNIEKVINLIKNSTNITEAKNKLMSISWQILDKYAIILDKYKIPSEILVKNYSYNLNDKQVNSILELKLYKLNNLEYIKIIQEYKDINQKIIFFNQVLNNKIELLKIIKTELIELKNNYGDDRLTTIDTIDNPITLEKNHILKKKLLITLDNNGYIKSQLLSDYITQHRGGKGKYINKIKYRTNIFSILVTNTNKVLLCFSNLGKVYFLQVNKIYVSNSSYNKGKPINNFISLKDDEIINNFLSINPFIYKNNIFLIMATAKGLIKKTPLIAFNNNRINGIIAINLKNQDKLIGVKLLYPNSYIILFTAFGKVVRFKEECIRTMGRNAYGIIGIKLKHDDFVVSIIVLNKEKEIITVTKNCYGKRTLIQEYPITKKANKGVKSMKITQKNGLVIKSIAVNKNEEVMLATNSGLILRMKVKEISLLKRNTQGVILMKKNANVELVDLQNIL